MGRSQLKMVWRTRLIFAFLVSGCGAPLPDGVDCKKQFAANSTEELIDHLSHAQGGDCVVLAQGEYDGPIVVTNGIHLVAQRDAQASIRGGEHDVTVRIRDSGSTVAGLSIRDGAGFGMLIEGGGVQVLDTTVAGFEDGAVGIRCQNEGCASGGQEVQLDSVELSQSGVGLWLDHAYSTVTASDIRNNRRGMWGAGLIVQRGSHLTVDNTNVSGNALGIVADGDDTRLSLDSVSVTKNRDRGIWLQGLQGTRDEPAFKLSGAQTLIEENGWIGLGLSGCRGAELTEGTIGATLPKLVAVGMGQFVEIGDGVGLFDSTAEVTVDAMTLRSSSRAQAIVDRAGAQISFGPDNAVIDGSAGLKIVVQNSQETVDVPDHLLSTTDELRLRSDANLALSEIEL